VQRRWIILVVMAVLALAGSVGIWWWHSQKIEVLPVKPAELQLDTVEKTHRIVLFVHGTFGSTLGLLDIPSVMKDNLKGSLYTKTARSMRKDRFFFCTQPLLDRGLRSFEPSFDRSSDDGGFAVYPIGKCFEKMAHYAWGDGEVRHYYVFGWSGLLSQHKRRQEALRLLNELTEEVKKFKKRNITPKITIISHSHGGNVVLNMGLLAAELNGYSYEKIPEFEQAESVTKTRLFLAEQPERTAVQSAFSHKRWDYRPEKPAWTVEHFVLLGTPIQPETDFGILSPLFEHVYNCYSYADRVQPNDWISTSRYYSEQKFDRVKQVLSKYGQSIPKSLVQLRILFERSCDAEGRLVYTTEGGAMRKKRTAWNMLVGDLSSAPAHTDPTHKELWFIVSPKHDQTAFLKPLPVSVLAPVMIKLQSLSPESCDGDCNIALRDGVFNVELADHMLGIVRERIKIPYTEIKALQNAVRNWEVSAEFLEKEEALLSSHVRVGREC